MNPNGIKTDILMKKLMQILFLSCLKATEFIEKKLNHKLSFKEKIQLKVHKSMCQACSNYEKQSKLIDKVMSETKIENVNKEDIISLKKSIVQKIAEK